LTAGAAEIAGGSDRDRLLTVLDPALRRRLLPRMSSSSSVSCRMY